MTLNVDQLTEWLRLATSNGVPAYTFTYGRGHRGRRGGRIAFFAWSVTTRAASDRELRRARREARYDSKIRARSR